MPEIMYRWRCVGEFGCGSYGFAHSDPEAAAEYGRQHAVDCVGTPEVEPVEPWEAAP